MLFGPRVTKAIRADVLNNHIFKWNVHIVWVKAYWGLRYALFRITCPNFFGHSAYFGWDVFCILDFGEGLCRSKLGNTEERGILHRVAHSPAIRVFVRPRTESLEWHSRRPLSPSLLLPRPLVCRVGGIAKKKHIVMTLLQGKQRL